MRNIQWIRVLALVAVMWPAVARSASMQQKPPDSECSAETLNGDYAISIRGTRPAPGSPPGTIEDLIGVGIVSFDGKGNFTQITNEKGALSGIAVPDRAGYGTYSVNSDCSGTLTLTLPGLPFTITDDLVVADRGRQYHAIVVSPQLVMVTSEGRRVK